MSFNLTLSFAKSISEKNVKTAVSISREGLVLMREYENGEEVVLPSAGLASEDIVGFSASDNDSNDDTVRQEQVVVPTVAPFTVQLDRTTPITGQVSITGLVLNAGVAAGQFDMNATGQLTFNTAEAGQTFSVLYRYSLSVAEAKDLFRQRHVNNSAGADFERVSVWGGKGEIQTDQFDASGDYASGEVFAGANGLAAATGNVKIGNVTHFPSIENPFLGISFNI